MVLDNYVLGFANGFTNYAIMTTVNINIVILIVNENSETKSFGLAIYRSRLSRYINNLTAERSFESLVNGFFSCND